MIHLPKIELVYISDVSVYKLWKVRHKDHTTDYFIFRSLSQIIGDGYKHFDKHTTIREAMIAATSYRSIPEEQMASQRGDFDYFLIDGCKVDNLRFLNFI